MQVGFDLYLFVFFDVIYMYRHFVLNLMLGLISV